MLIPERQMDGKRIKVFPEMRYMLCIGTCNTETEWKVNHFTRCLDNILQEMWMVLKARNGKRRCWRRDEVINALQESKY